MSCAVADGRRLRIDRVRRGDERTRKADVVHLPARHVEQLLVSAQSRCTPCWTYLSVSAWASRLDPSILLGMWGLSPATDLVKDTLTASSVICDTTRPNQGYKA